MLIHIKDRVDVNQHGGPSMIIEVPGPPNSKEVVMFSHLKNILYISIPSRAYLYLAPMRLCVYYTLVPLYRTPPPPPPSHSSHYFHISHLLEPLQRRDLVFMTSVDRCILI